MNKLAEAYIEQYHKGLITLGELADRLREVDTKSQSYPKIRSGYESNYDDVRTFVMNECACHWGFFRENCPESELDEFCNSDCYRTKDEIQAFVEKYI